MRSVGPDMMLGISSPGHDLLFTLRNTIADAVLPRIRCGVMTERRTLGILLAAGAGSRMGRPKALVAGADGRPWTHTAVAALRGGGCADVIVVLGAQAEAAARLLDDPGVTVVTADDWADGMSASLRAGLTAAGQRPGELEAVVVTLVDLPDIDGRVVARVVEQVGAAPSALGRAAYHGVPGHPVVIGIDHIPGVLASTAGDQGARDYLRTHPLTLVECGDLATGRDIDSPG